MRGNVEYRGDGVGEKRWLLSQSRGRQKCKSMDATPQLTLSWCRLAVVAAGGLLVGFSGTHWVAVVDPITRR